MKNKTVLIFGIILITACGTAKKIDVGNGSIVQLPPNSRKISIEAFNTENAKFEHPIFPLDNRYITDNALVSFRNVRNMVPNERSLEEMKKSIARLHDWSSPTPGIDTVSRVSVSTINNNEVLTWRIKTKNQLIISFFCNSATKKLAVNGEVQTTLSDSTKANNIARFIVKHIKFAD